MKQNIFKTALGALFVTALLTGCASGLSVAKKDTLRTDITNLPAKKTALEDTTLKAWGAKDMYLDSIPGMSVDRAYDELIKDKKGETVVVGVLDSGTDIHHEDLAAVIWVNKKEIAGNRKDDDHNGFTDDIHGWNFLGDAIYDNVEYARILKILKPRFDGKSEADIQPEEEQDFALYQRAQEEYDKEYAEARQSSARYGQIKENIAEYIDLLKEAGGKDNLTPDEVAGLEPENTNEEIAKHMIVNILGQTGAKDTDEILEQLDEAFKYFSNKAEYHLNLDFNGRELVGDDVDDIKDTDYGNNDVTGPSKDKEDILHGTHVAGIIGAVRNNDIGMNGVANQVKLMVIRAVPDGDEYDKDIALGIRYAVDNGAKVINMSFGKYYSTHPEWVNEAIQYAAQHDVLLVKAAGNEGLNLDETRSYPNDQWPGQDTEIADNVIVVGALTPEYGEDMVASFSNYGKKSVDVFAPGAQIWATAPLNKYKFLQGTSMAAPGVAGIAAVIRSYFPKLTASQVKKVIMDSGLTSTKEVILGGNPDHKKSFNEISRSGKMANLYNALIMAAQL